MNKKLFLVIVLLVASTSIFAQCDSIFLAQGKIVSNSSKTVEISFYDWKTMPEVGQIGELHKYFEKFVFGMQTTGWLGVADVDVTKVNGNTVSMKILEEKSEIIINGEKTNHFLIGNIMKLTWISAPKTEKNQK